MRQMDIEGWEVIFLHLQLLLRMIIIHTLHLQIMPFTQNLTAHVETYGLPRAT